MSEQETMPGVETLRSKRGDEEVTFDNVADHLIDFVVRHPGAQGTIDRLALFLANVEDRHHEHEQHPARGIEPDKEVPH